MPLRTATRPGVSIPRLRRATQAQKTPVSKILLSTVARVLFVHSSSSHQGTQILLGALTGRAAPDTFQFSFGEVAIAGECLCQRWRQVQVSAMCHRVVEAYDE